MGLKGWIPRAMSVPRGMWESLKNRRAGTPSRASLMQNMRVRFGTVRSRAGTSVAFGPTGQVTGMFNWVTPSEQNLVLYQDGNAIKAHDQAIPGSATVLKAPVTCRAPSFAPIDVWCYFCGFDTSAKGTFQTQVFDGTSSDTAFRGPPTILDWSAADAGSGYVTQGQHFFGFVYQNRTGYQGIPVTSVVFPITATTNVSFAVTATTSPASPDVLSVPGHTFSDGDKVTGAGATGDTAINGVFLIANSVAGVSVELTTLDGTPINGTDPYTGGGTLTAPDLVTAPGNNVQVGEQVTISGATGDTAINGTRIIATTPTSGTFTMTDTDGNIINSNGAYTGGGSLSNPIQFTTSSGLRKVNVVVTLPPQPDGGSDANGGVQAKLFLIATRADNPNLWYFVPDNPQTGQIGEQDVPLNTQVDLHFVFNSSDEDMATSFDSAQNNFSLLSQDANGVGPFNPSFVVAYGQRMCYGAGTTLYVSDINAPQQIAGDLNAIRMQNQRLIGAAFQLPGNPSLYVTGDRWIGYVTDNSDTPSTWGEPIGTSDTLGAQFPNHVCAATGGNYVWIVTESGPYYFDGQFSSNQLLYLITGYDEDMLPTGWNRVNWNAAYAIQIRDDVANLKLYVAVPLDGATECNFMFVIDYRMGKTFETVDIGIDLFTPQLFSSIAVIKEQATGRTNVWIGPATAGNITRFDSTTHNDLGSAIQCIWQSGLMRGSNIQPTMARFGYLDIWIRGHAQTVDGESRLGLAIISLDTQIVITPDMQINMGVPASLTNKPGLYYSAKFDMTHVSNCTVAFQSNGVDDWFELSGFTLFEKPDLTNR